MHQNFPEYSKLLELCSCGFYFSVARTWLCLCLFNSEETATAPVALQLSLGACLFEDVQWLIYDI